jgi:protein-arginine kinase activator protein McsA
MRYEDLFTCSCGSTEWNLDDSQLKYGIAYKVCNQCGHKQQLEVNKEKCYGCGRVYYALTWYKPSGCSYCHRSFVD